MRSLHVALEPVTRVEILHVEVFYADVSAVGFVESGDEGAEF